MGKDQRAGAFVFFSHVSSFIKLLESQDHKTRYSLHITIDIQENMCAAREPEHSKNPLHC